MTLEIITPEKSIFNGKIKLVQFPGASGSFEVLENHAPLVAALKQGTIKIKDTDSKITLIEIKGGTMHVENNHVLVLAD